MIPNYSMKEALSKKYEQEFKETCVLYPRSGFHFGSVYGKIVKSKGNFIFIVLPSDDVKVGMTFFDKSNKSSFKVTRVNKKSSQHPKNQTSDFIYLDVCEIQYLDKKDSKK